MENDDDSQPSDPAPTSSKASMTPVELNNLVVSLRKTTRQAKVHTIRTLSRQIELYRKKKGNEKQVQTNQKKAERLHEELKVIKKLDIDWISKFALYNTSSLQEVANKRVETKAMVRIAIAKVLQAKVRVFRAAHTDWEELASFLISKTTGRRFKKLKFGPSKLKPAAHLDVESAIDLKNPEVSQVAEGGGTAESIPATQETNPQTDPEDKSQDEEEDKSEDTLRLERSSVIEDLEKDDQSDEERSTESDGEDSSQTSGTCTKAEESPEIKMETVTTPVEKIAKLASPEEGVEKKSPKDGAAKRIISSKVKVKSPKKMLVEVKSPTKTEAPKQTLTKAQPKSQTKGLMVIKKFSLEDSGEGETESTEEEKDTSFLFQKSEESKAVDVGIKDSFFMGGDNDESDSETDHPKDESDFSSDEDLPARAKRSLDSAFTKSLSSKRPRRDDFHSNRDSSWRGGFDRERGGFDQGRGGSGRERGRFDRSRGGFDRGRGRFDRGRGGSDWGRGSRGRGGYESREASRGKFDRDRAGYSGRGHGHFSKDFHRGSKHFSTSENTRRSGGFGRDDSRSKWEKTDRPKGNQWPPKDAKKDSSAKELHPSWQASLKKKQEQKIMNFQGKKTVFEDD